jgi:hypothetical protein
MSRRVAAVLVLPLALALAAAVQPPASGTSRYRIETSAATVADLSGLGQGEQRTEFAVMAMVTITLTDSAGGKVLHAVLDSSRITPPLPGAPPGGLEGDKGAMYHAWINPSGRTENFKVMGDSTAPKGGIVVMQVLRDFFPNVKPGFKAGDAWRDSTETKDNDAGATSSTIRITEYSVGAVAPWAGVTGNKVDTKSSFTVSIASETPGGPQNVEGSGTGAASWYVTPAGVFLGGTSTTSAELTAMTAFGDIPVKQSSTTTITALP